MKNLLSALLIMLTLGVTSCETENIQDVTQEIETLSLKKVIEPVYHSFAIGDCIYYAEYFAVTDTYGEPNLSHCISDMDGLETYPGPHANVDDMDRIEIDKAYTYYVLNIMYLKSLNSQRDYNTKHNILVNKTLYCASGGNGPFTIHVFENNGVFTAEIQDLGPTGSWTGGYIYYTFKSQFEVDSWCHNNAIVSF